MALRPIGLARHDVRTAMASLKKAAMVLTPAAADGSSLQDLDEAKDPYKAEREELEKLHDKLEVALVFTNEPDE